MESSIDVEIVGPDLVRETFRSFLHEAAGLRVVEQGARVRLYLDARWLPRDEPSGHGSDTPLRPSMVLLVRDPDREMPAGWDHGVRVFVGDHDAALVVIAAVFAAAVGGWFVSPALNRSATTPPSTLTTFRRVAFHSDLTPRQRLVMQLCADGCSYKEIAQEVGVSIETVRTHLKRARRRHQLPSG